MGNFVSVYYLQGIQRTIFDELKELGYEINIPPEEDKLKVMAYSIEPDDYIQIFSIYFTLKVTEELAKGTAKQLLKKFPKTIKNIWSNLKNTKPAIIRANEEPNYKLPKASIVFEISEDEKSTIEISNAANQEEMETMMYGYIELVKLQFENRLKETEKKEQYKIKNPKKKR